MRYLCSIDFNPLGLLDNIQYNIDNIQYKTYDLIQVLDHVFSQTGPFFLSSASTGFYTAPLGM